MISEFIREQKRYTRDDLKLILSCSDTEVIRIIKKLKDYGILKTVKNTNEQLNMSDLANEDVEVSNEDEFTVKYLYVFVFVGIIIVEGRVLKCYPKYLFKAKNPTEELKQVMKVLKKYNSKEQLIHMYNNSNGITIFNRLAIIIYLINDYFENGVYTNTQDIVEINGMGEIYWDRTINNSYPIINDNCPYYVELQTKRRINDETDFFKRLHECILTSCSKELRESDLLELLDMEGTDLSDEILDDFGDDDYILYRLEKEMNVQFNTRKQTILKIMEALIVNKGSINELDSFTMLGTNKFNLVWEKVCAEVMDNQLHIPINALGIDNIVIPKGVIYTNEDELISVIGKPKWQGYAEDESEFEKQGKKTLTPDIISIYRYDQGTDFIIFDAKYYTIQLEVMKELCGEPGVSDITKQYLYQLAYKDFISVNKFSNIRNCFLMPTEEEGTNGVIKKGSVRMDMFAALGLEKIQVRQLSAKRMFEYYLVDKKINIGILNL